MSEMTVEHESVADPATSDEQLIAMLVDRARSKVLQLTGEGGLLQQLTKKVLESALEGEITDDLGYEKHHAAGRNTGNSRNAQHLFDYLDWGLKSYWGQRPGASLRGQRHDAAATQHHRTCTTSDLVPGPGSTTGVA